jgi:predicted RNA binding protein YcfA (HicA-like mRNA interferase family)
MKASLLIQILEKGGWQQSRRIRDDIVFSHPEHTNLISIPDLGDQAIKVELLNEIFQAAGLEARVHKMTFNPSNLLKKLTYLFNG